METRVAQLPQAIWSLRSLLCCRGLGSAAGWWLGHWYRQGAEAHGREKTMLAGQSDVLSLAAVMDLVQLLNL